ncbi:MAG: peptidoglycan DD-metalloendopeptidase family protein [Dokdonella sp.]
MEDLSRKILAAVLTGSMGLLAACASTGPAPVEDRSAGAALRPATASPRLVSSAASSGGTYRVIRGDTLYSIAFRHGVDYRELASSNHIAAPYTIYVGQDIHIGTETRNRNPSAIAQPPPAPMQSASTAIAAKAIPASPHPDNAASAAPAPFEDVSASTLSTNRASTLPTTSKATTPTPASETAPPPTGQVTTIERPVPNTIAPVAATPTAGASAVVGDVAWRWPAAGQVIGTYAAGDQTRQGIDIAGKAGDPVRAAADGTVVYSGNGLIGYGELIIVKHSPNFLSAYGHNRSRLVKEGDRVKAGQTIAEMGSSSASRDSLHFEIRKNGKPTNPLDYLPRR